MNVLGPRAVVSVFLQLLHCSVRTAVRRGAAGVQAAAGHGYFHLHYHLAHVHWHRLQLHRKLHFLLSRVAFTFVAYCLSIYLSIYLRTYFGAGAGCVLRAVLSFGGGYRGDGEGAVVRRWVGGRTRY